MNYTEIATVYDRAPITKLFQCFLEVTYTRISNETFMELEKRQREVFFIFVFIFYRKSYVGLDKRIFL